MKNSLKNLLLVFCIATASVSFAQGITEYTGGFKVKLNEDGSKYFRMITWGQFWAQYQDDVPDNTSKLNLSVRRARLLTYAQLNKKFLILTHFGLNSLNGNNISPLGKGESAQLFFHGFWGEYRLGENHAIGAGLHYWNGISRLNSQSTLNFMTLDNNRQSWATIGLSDQFARHIGVYLKGKLEKFHYQIALNEAVSDNLQATVDPVNGGPAIYAGRRLLGSKDAGKTYAGYFDYQFLDQESNFLPYRVGSYLGSKKVFNVGAGFFLHPSGSVVADATGNLTGEDVSIFAVDAFYDSPLSDNGDAITAYATFQSNDYGEDFLLGTTYATGNMIYSHVGYLLPGEQGKTRFQPYLSFNTRQIDAIDDNATRFGFGANAYFTGHHSKLSLEYSNQKFGDADAIGSVTLQAMIYL
ncbi:hypothetical protein ABN763_16790 [Spongiivirga sp. MCCC 1A20706]|uniref:hypothetical protein n=1 Tax=Spongiivirga sp. MCCC 1A20706 TaxID=3160963 RepID=UPI003977AF06